MHGNDDDTRKAHGQSDIATATAKQSDPALEATVRASDTGRDSGVERARGDRVGRYRITEVLGSGGMGVVYRAHDPELDRELAIKVVRPGSQTANAQERLLAEARAMAKLRHPAVVPVFDVGSTADSVYIVMPLVSGGTMYDWLRAAKRSWRDVLDRFLAAGRGLVAAHDAGLIHRDFKPRNILVSDSGDVLVADFGIAAVAGDAVGQAAASTPGSAMVSSIAGTPAYMAPEQADSATIDARADQYSFCISLWEGLCGKRPSESETRTGRNLPGNITTFRKQKDTTAPAWLLAAVARGFSALPSERWPSMSALISFLERRRARPKKLALAGIGVAIAAASAAVVMIAPGDKTNPCPDTPRYLAGIWTPEVRAQVQAAFAATGVSYAQHSLERVLPVLDRYANEWRKTRIAACRAAVVEHTQSAELYDRRVTCLDRRLDVMRTRTTLFARIDPESLARAEELAESLPPLSDCNDVDALLAAYPTPSDRTARTKIVDLERRIHDLDTFAIRGAPKEVLEKANALASEARALDHPPTVVLALQSLSEAQRQSNADAEKTQRELVEVAARAHDDVALAAGWSRLIVDLAKQRRFDEARALEPVAEAALTRAGAPESLVFRVNSDLGRRAYEEDDLDVAINRQQRALSAAKTPFERRAAMADLAAAWRANANVDKALPLVEAALKDAEAIHGTQHPVVASTLVGLATTLQTTGNPEDLKRAASALERALAIRKAAFGENSPMVAETLSVIATTATQHAEYQKADEALRMAISIMEPRGDSLLLGKLYRRWGDNTTYLTGFEAARPQYDRALKILEAATGRSSLEYVYSSLNYAMELSDRGECTVALRYADNARTVLEPRGNPYAASAYMILGKCEIAAKRNAEGIAWMEKALELCATAKCFTGYVEDVEYYLGTKLFESGIDRGQGIALVKKSRDGFAALGRDEAVEQLDDWLKKHPK